jgi:hypothetical protein
MFKESDFKYKNPFVSIHLPADSTQERLGLKL